MSIRFQKTLLALGILIHILFYVSAHRTGWLNRYFEQVTRGQDFFQVPNGAYAWLRGGSLTGKMPHGEARYSDCCGVNDNVYHPLFTLLVGIPLQLFNPWTAFYIWLLAHGLAVIWIAISLYKSDKNHPLIFFSLALLLGNFYWYYEINHAQYHFLFAFFTFLFLQNLRDKKREETAWFWLFLSLLVKPIGLLWTLPLIIWKKYKTVFWGAGLFFMVTALFSLWQPSRYYFDNLRGLKNIFPAYNIGALSHFIPIDHDFLNQFRDISAIILILVQLGKRQKLLTAITGWICWQVVFYGGVYHYYYVIFAVILPLLIVENELKFNWWTWWFVFLTTIQPLIFVLFLLGGKEALPNNYNISALIATTGGLIGMLYTMSTGSTKNEVEL